MNSDYANVTEFEWVGASSDTGSPLLKRFLVQSTPDKSNYRILIKVELFFSGQAFLLYIIIFKVKISDKTMFFGRPKMRLTMDKKNWTCFAK